MMAKPTNQRTRWLFWIPVIYIAIGLVCAVVAYQGSEFRNNSGKWNVDSITFFFVMPALVWPFWIGDLIKSFNRT
jgi:hypothetical protein